MPLNIVILVKFRFKYSQSFTRPWHDLRFVDEFRKQSHFITCHKTLKSLETARLSTQRIFKLHGMPNEIISTKDFKFTINFWFAMFEILRTTFELFLLLVLNLMAIYRYWTLSLRLLSMSKKHNGRYIYLWWNLPTTTMYICLPKKLQMKLCINKLIRPLLFPLKIRYLCLKNLLGTWIMLWSTCVLQLCSGEAKNKSTKDQRMTKEIKVFPKNLLIFLSCLESIMAILWTH